MQAFRFVLALVVAIGLVSFAAAGDKADKKAAKKGTQGLVEKVDSTAKTLTLKTGKKKDPNAPTLTVTITDTTKFSTQTEDGMKEAKLADVVAGKRVMVKKETKDGKEVATEIVVVEGKKKKTS
jgi:hypothetical protein